MSSQDEDITLSFLNDLLSRFDTLHDFGNRSRIKRIDELQESVVLVFKKTIIEILDQNDALKEKSLVEQYGKLFLDRNNQNVKNLLNRQFNIPASYVSDTTLPETYLNLSQWSHYESKVVAFLENACHIKAPNTTFGRMRTDKPPEFSFISAEASQTDDYIDRFTDYQTFIGKSLYLIKVILGSARSCEKKTGVFKVQKVIEGGAPKKRAEESAMCQQKSPKRPKQCDQSGPSAPCVPTDEGEVEADEDEDEDVENLGDILKRIRSIIGEYYSTYITSDTDVRLIVDISGISFSKLYRDAADTMKKKGEDLSSLKIQVICNAATTWDSASSCECQYVSELPDALNYDTSDANYNKNARSVYGLKRLVLDQTSNRSKQADLTVRAYDDSSDPIVDYSLDKFPRTLKDTAICIDSTLKKDICKTFEKKFKDKNIFLDFKRSGDALQVLMTKKLNSSRSMSQNKDPFHIFVTRDHLAFAKARLHQVPSMFVTMDDCNKIMYMFNPNPPSTLDAFITRFNLAKRTYTAVKEKEKYKTVLDKILEDPISFKTEMYQQHLNSTIVETLKRDEWEWLQQHFKNIHENIYRSDDVESSIMKLFRIYQELCDVIIPQANKKIDKYFQPNGSAMSGWIQISDPTNYTIRVDLIKNACIQIIETFCIEVYLRCEAAVKNHSELTSSIKTTDDKYSDVFVGSLLQEYRITEKQTKISDLPKDLVGTLSTAVDRMNKLCYDIAYYCDKDAIVNEYTQYLNIISELVTAKIKKVLAFLKTQSKAYQGFTITKAVHPADKREAAVVNEVDPREAAVVNVVDPPPPPAPSDNFEATKTYTDGVLVDLRSQLIDVHMSVTDIASQICESRRTSFPKTEGINVDNGNGIPYTSIAGHHLSLKETNPSSSLLPESKVGGSGEEGFGYRVDKVLDDDKLVELYQQEYSERNDSASCPLLRLYQRYKHLIHQCVPSENLDKEADHGNILNSASGILSSLTFPLSTTKRQDDSNSNAPSPTVLSAVSSPPRSTIHSSPASPPSGMSISATTTTTTTPFKPERSDEGSPTSPQEHQEDFLTSTKSIVLRDEKDLEVNENPEMALPSNTNPSEKSSISTLENGDLSEFQTHLYDTIQQFETAIQEMYSQNFNRNLLWLMVYDPAFLLCHPLREEEKWSEIEMNYIKQLVQDYQDAEKSRELLVTPDEIISLKITFETGFRMKACLQNIISREQVGSGSSKAGQTARTLAYYHQRYYKPYYDKYYK